MFSNNTISAEVLGQISIIQSMVPNLPDKRSIFRFVCRGLEDVPGVDSVSYRILTDDFSGNSHNGNNNPEVHRFPIKLGQFEFGELLLRISDTDRFSPYIPYLENLNLMLAFILEERHQRRELEAYRNELEQRVEERTRALKQSEQLLAKAFDNAPIGMVLVRPDGYFFRVNATFCQITGYSEEELLTKKFQDISLVDDHPVGSEIMSQIIEGKESKGNFEKRYVHKKGNIIYAHVTTSLLRDEQGEPLYFFSQIQDISERKEVEEQLRQSHKMEAIGTLAGGIAHDFNNILGIIIGNTELAMDDLPQWNPSQLFLNEIKTAGLRAKDLIYQLLNFTRKSEVERKPVRIHPIIKEAVRMLRSSIPTTIEIRSDIPEGLGGINADPTQINQVLINLCTNGCHAMEDGGGVLDVILEEVEFEKKETFQRQTVGPGKYIQLIVRDNGSGIPDEVQAKIFDPYFTTKEFGKGTGMGLSVVKGIVNSHEGAIFLDSTPGKGTEARVLFPMVDVAPAAETKTAEEMPGGNESILFIDDETSITELSRLLLERLGYSVQVCTDPVTALDRFTAEPGRFDLVITDMAMPKMSGVRLAGEILKICPDMPVILCTGYSENLDEAKAKEAGIAMLMEKPLKWRDLSLAVRAVLDKRKKIITLCTDICSKNRVR